MPVPFKCGECQFTTKVKDELAGKRIKCPKCQTVGVVAAGDGSEPLGKPKKAKKEDSVEGLMNLNLESFKDVEVPEGEVLDESQLPKKVKTKKKKKGAGLDSTVKLAAVAFSLISILVIAGLVMTVGPTAMEKYQDFMTPAAEKAPADGAANPAPPA